MSKEALIAAWDAEIRPAVRKLMVLAFAAFADDKTSEAWPSMTTLARRCSISSAQARRHVQDLVRLGCLDLLKEGGGENATRYKVNVAWIANPTGIEKPRAWGKTKVKRAGATPITDARGTPSAHARGVTAETPLMQGADPSHAGDPTPLMQGGDPLHAPTPLGDVAWGKPECPPLLLAQHSNERSREKDAYARHVKDLRRGSAVIARGIEPYTGTSLHG